MDIYTTSVNELTHTLLKDPLSIPYTLPIISAILLPLAIRFHNPSLTPPEILALASDLADEATENHVGLLAEHLDPSDDIHSHTSSLRLLTTLLHTTTHHLEQPKGT